MTSDTTNTPAHQELAKLPTSLASSMAFEGAVVAEREEGDKDTKLSVEKASEGAEDETGESVKPKESDELKRMKKKANKQKRRERRKAEKMQGKPEMPMKPRAPIDIERQCGVQLPNGARCARSLTCKSHSRGAKRALPGRSKPFDDLLTEYREKNASKQALVAKGGSQLQPGAQGVEGEPATESRPEIS